MGAHQVPAMHFTVTLTSLLEDAHPEAFTGESSPLKEWLVDLSIDHK